MYANVVELVSKIYLIIFSIIIIICIVYHLVCKFVNEFYHVCVDPPDIYFHYRDVTVSDKDPLLPKTVNSRFEKSEEHKAKDFQLISVPQTERTVSCAGCAAHNCMQGGR